MSSRIITRGAGKSSAGAAGVAYSYLRFSSPEQADGDSMRRQTALRESWLERHPKVRLDTSLTLADKGVSGFTGEHRKNPDRHALAAFLRQVESGRIPKGSYLLVENLDRLSREHIQPSTLLFLNLLQAGVRVVQLSPVEMVFDSSSEMTQIMMAIIELSRGNSESRMKSERVGAAWAGKRETARKGGTMNPRKKDGRVTEAATDMLPAWVREKDGKMVLITERARAVRRIYKLASAGYGTKRICERLTAEGHKPFGEREVYTDKNGKERYRRPKVDGVRLGSGRWTKGYVHAILADRRAVGEYQPRNKDGKSEGEPFPYYPPAVSKDEWSAAKAGLAARRCVGEDEPRRREPELDAIVKRTAADTPQDEKLSIAEASKLTKRSETWVRIRRVRLGITKRRDKEKKAEAGESFVNIFKSLLREARSGKKYMVIMRQDLGGRRRVLVKSEAREDRSPCYSFPYPVFEEAILNELREVDPKEVLGEEDAGPNEVMVLSGQLADLDTLIKTWEAKMDDPNLVDTVSRKLSTWNAKRRELVEKLNEVQYNNAHPRSESWGEFKSLVDTLAKAPDKADARSRLWSALRRIVESIWVLVVPRGHHRLAAVQVNFAGGARRNYLVFHRPPTANGQGAGTPGGWWAGSTKHPDDGLVFEAFGEPMTLNDWDFVTGGETGCDVELMTGSLEAYPMDLVDRLIDDEPLWTPALQAESDARMAAFNAELEKQYEENQDEVRPPAKQKKGTRPDRA